MLISMVNDGYVLYVARARPDLKCNDTRYTFGPN